MGRSRCDGSLAGPVRRGGDKWRRAARPPTVRRAAEAEAEAEEAEAEVPLGLTRLSHDASRERNYRIALARGWSV